MAKEDRLGDEVKIVRGVWRCDRGTAFRRWMPAYKDGNQWRMFDGGLEIAEVDAILDESQLDQLVDPVEMDVSEDVWESKGSCPEIVKTASDEVNEALMEGLEFSLCCVYCDAGMEVDSPIAAKQAGWVDLQVEDELSTNFSGVCPGCKRDPAIFQEDAFDLWGGWDD